mgnify:CR=1 FL=1
MKYMLLYLIHSLQTMARSNIKGKIKQRIHLMCYDKYLCMVS